MTFRRLRLASLSLLLSIALLGVSLVASPRPSHADTPAGPAYASEVSIFFYPWYATPGHDGHWAHWDQGNHAPPAQIGSNYYPLRAVYSSADTATIKDQMQQIAAAGIDTVVVSWWGRDSYEDKVLAQIVGPARDVGVKVAVHIEPYDGRSENIRNDFDYLRGYGIRDYYIYQAASLPATAIRSINDAFGDDRVFGEASNEESERNGSFEQWLQDQHFQGFYNYDPRGFSPDDFQGLCDRARSHHLLCMPSVGPGWNATRATTNPFVVDRENGAYYDRSWQAAIDAHADIVTITSYNEWHEGTQIEPAAGTCASNPSYCYLDYEGAYGLHGSDASWAYLNHTLTWSAAAKGHPLTLSQRLTVVASALQQNDAGTLARFKRVTPQQPPQ